MSRVVGDLDQDVRRVELLTEVDDALHVVAEYLIALLVEVALIQEILVSFDQGKNHLFVRKWTLEKVLEVPLFVDLIG